MGIKFQNLKLVALFQFLLECIAYIKTIQEIVVEESSQFVARYIFKLGKVLQTSDYCIFQHLLMFSGEDLIETLEEPKA